MHSVLTLLRERVSFSKTLRRLSPNSSLLQLYGMTCKSINDKRQG
jgi:hypothetical protein